MIQIPLEIGDIILTGRFKNKKVTVKEIGTDDYGNPTINGRSILKIRIPKLYQQQENNMNLKESSDDTLIQNVIDTYNHTKSGKMSLGGKREAMTYKKVADKTGFITVGNSGIDYWVMMTDKGIKHFKLKSKTEIKEEVKSFQKSPIEVKIRKDGERFHIFLQTVDGEQQLSIQGWETKEQAEHAAMMKGYKYDGNPYFEKHKGIEVPKATKSEPVKHEKPKEIDLGKEKDLKLENFIREFIRTELSKNKVQLKEEIAVNDAEIEEYAKLVDQIDKMKAELSKLTKRFDELDEKFKKMLDVLESELGESKENFIRYKNILITIKRKGYERTNYKYKEAFDELYKKVNANMKKMIDEVLEANKTITKVSSSLSVQYEANNFITNIFNRVKTWFVSFIGKLRNTNKSTKQLLDQLESKV